MPSVKQELTGHTKKQASIAHSMEKNKEKLSLKDLLADTLNLILQNNCLKHAQRTKDAEKKKKVN